MGSSRGETRVRVERAIILAAGIGSRMLPLTKKTPKPLVKVHGKRIIDSLLDALVLAEIPEIYIVRGYLAKKFDVLKEKYPNIHFIENHKYAEANNIFSVLCAGELVKNSYIMEADLLLKKPCLITREQTVSNYLAIPVEQTNDWCFQTTPERQIEKMKIGGKACWQMVGISYWTAKEGEQLVSHAKKLYQTADGKRKYWDQIALEAYSEEYKVFVRECYQDDVVEIDTFAELQQIDESYR